MYMIDKNLISKIRHQGGVILKSSLVKEASQANLPLEELARAVCGSTTSGKYWPVWDGSCKLVYRRAVPFGATAQEAQSSPYRWVSVDGRVERDFL